MLNGVVAASFRITAGASPCRRSHAITPTARQVFRVHRKALEKPVGEAGVLARYLRSRVGTGLRCHMGWRHLCEKKRLAGPAVAASAGYNDDVVEAA